MARSGSQTKRSVGASVEHGPDTAAYAGGPGEPYYRPFIICLCGWSSGRQTTWQFVGELFDEHLAETDKPRGKGGRRKGR